MCMWQRVVKSFSLFFLSLNRMYRMCLYGVSCVYRLTTAAIGDGEVRDGSNNEGGFLCSLRTLAAA